MSDWVPLSVRTGGVRAKLNWAVKGLRDRVALQLAPWRDLEPCSDCGQRITHKPYYEATCGCAWHAECWEKDE